MTKLSTNSSLRTEETLTKKSTVFELSKTKILSFLVILTEI